MRDFDALRNERDLSFKIGGETFSMKIVPFTIWGEWEKAEEGLDFSKSEDYVKGGLARIRSVLDDSNGQLERWDRLIADGRGPSYGELGELMTWVVEEQARRPTEQPSTSAVGAGPTGTSSKGK